jgi:hypothetical protein
MEYALSMQDPFLSAGLEVEKARKLNLPCSLRSSLLEYEQKGSRGKESY